MTQAALAQFQNRRLEIEETGRATSVPDNNLARLMYYLSCLSNTMDKCVPRKLTDYRRYDLLNDTEKLQVAALAVQLSPDKIPTFIEVPSLPGGKCNQFLRFSSIDETVTALGIEHDGAAMMALRRQLGNKRQLVTVMAYTREWIRRHYIDPLEAVNRELEFLALLAGNRESSRRCPCCRCRCCTIL